MNKVVRPLLVLALAASAVTVRAGPSLCTQLADEVRRAPAAAWAQPDPLSRWVRREPVAAPSATVDALQRDSRWREAVGALHPRPLEVQRLAGTPVHLLSDYGGTANCQTLALVQARPGQASRPLKPPFALEGLNLCVTESASLAQVLGQPALIVGGAPRMTSPDLRYRIARWSGQAWAGRCSVELKRRWMMSAEQRFCRPGAVACDTAQAAAQRLAAAYETSRATDQPLDLLALNGAVPPDAMLAAGGESFNLPFPLFGADERSLDPMLTVFSNAAPRRVPLFVDGRWWLAIVGRSGVGWREGSAVLVALFAPPGREADGVASYQFHVRPAGPVAAVARDE